MTLGGAHPIFAFTRHINRDEFLDETFVFRGTDINLPPGITKATVTGSLTTGQTFSSSTKVFNRNLSFYQTAKVENQIAKREHRPNKRGVPRRDPGAKASQSARGHGRAHPRGRELTARDVLPHNECRDQSQ